MKSSLLTIIFFLLSSTISFSQNENAQWYFGTNAGLDFTSNPPTVLTNGAMSNIEGCASISSPAGALLFYTEGTTIWNSSHLPMANGTGLFGSASTSQASIILKKPGSSNIYYVFSLTCCFGSLHYSEVNMSLAAGSGSVVTKNVLVDTTLTEHLAAVRHCNGVDYWLMVHRAQSQDFLAYLVTSAGVNTTAVTSSIGSNIGNFYIGCMKFSPYGSKLGFAVSGGDLVELYDFNASTGVLSNSITLGNTPTYPYGVEFSPNGSKFYAKGHDNLVQWDLCSQPITASATSFTTVHGISSIQLANNGKIYVSRWERQMLGVVSSPNLAGLSCNYADSGQTIAPKIARAGLPNFVAGWPRPVSVAFTFTPGSSCPSASFAATLPNATMSICFLTNYYVQGVLWNFGDPSSGAANTSTLYSPVHNYLSPGTYTVKLILNYSCGGGTDTLTQQITVIAGSGTPSLNVTGNFTVCEGQSTTLSVTGANTYNWSSGSTTSLAVISTASNTIVTVSGTGTNGCVAQKTVTVSVSGCIRIDEQELFNHIIIFPNPSSGVLTIRNYTGIRLIIYDQLGKTIIDTHFQVGIHTLDLSSFLEGMYNIKIISGRNVGVMKLVRLD